MKRRPLIVGGTVAALFLGPIGYAFAAGHWSSPAGSGSALAVDYSLTAPTALSVSELSAPTIHLSWTAPQDATLSGFAYVLTRSAGTVTGGCASLTATSVACDDTGGTVGTSYTYSLRGKIGNWLGPIVASSSIKDLGVPSSVTAVTGTTPQSATVSTAFSTNLAATVKDSAGDLLSGVSVTFTAGSSGGATGSFGSGCTSGSGTTCTVLTNSSGIATASTFTANSTPGTYSVTASSGSAGTASFSLANTAAVSHTFVVTPSTTTPTAGAQFTVSIQAQSNGSSDLTYTGTKCITFSGPGSSPDSNAPVYPGVGTTNPCSTGQSQLSFTSGLASSVPITLYAAAQSVTLSVTDGTRTGTAALSVYSTNALTITGCPSPPTLQKGKNFSTTISRPAAADAYGNAADASALASIALGATSAGTGENWTSDSLGKTAITSTSVAASTTASVQIYANGESSSNSGTTSFTAAAWPYQTASCTVTMSS
jgi:hypothetical protein